ncbi:hypothetical protein CC80DRAFT_569483 [Byssothecium circinans]|uniref:Uncharacterized protein n=1 Tax=Byssothecium circinans TaxID=147558 RepID=A0A6A5TKP7_9PLEO|nr:hypothetical protein CC80DRAFT_569483 [Byssothecium circinans]
MRSRFFNGTRTWVGQQFSREFTKVYLDNNVFKIGDLSISLEPFLHHTFSVWSNGLENHSSDPRDEYGYEHRYAPSYDIPQPQSQYVETRRWVEPEYEMRGGVMPSRCTKPRRWVEPEHKSESWRVREYVNGPSPPPPPFAAPLRSRVRGKSFVASAPPLPPPPASAPGVTGTGYGNAYKLQSFLTRQQPLSVRRMDFPQLLCPRHPQKPNPSFPTLSTPPLSPRLPPPKSLVHSTPRSTSCPAANLLNTPNSTVSSTFTWLLSSFTGGTWSAFPLSTAAFHCEAERHYRSPGPAMRLRSCEDAKERNEEVIFAAMGEVSVQ